MIGASAVSCLRAWPPAPVQIWPSMTWGLCRARTPADIVSDESSGTKPNFVITVDAALAEEPDDIVAENHTA